jgi:ATP-dependent Clp protease adaptor protein ClpS
MSTQSDVAVAERQELKEPSKYKVVIHDNPFTSFEEVIFIVSRCFNKTEEEAAAIANKVHLEKKGVCGVYSKEVAESKLQLVDMAKQFLITNFRHRKSAIEVLKFTLEEE